MDGPAELTHPVGVEAEPPRRRWGPAHAAGAVAAIALAGVLAVAVPGKSDGDDARPVETRTSEGPPAGPSAATRTASRVQLDVPAGWQTLHASGDRLVAATHPLAERDLQLALLARSDPAFAAFPPGGAVFVVGGDRMQAKYVSDPSQATRTVGPGGVEAIQAGPPIGPGPEFGLGPAASLRGGVTARRGDLPRSSVVLAAYIGRQAPAGAMQEAEAMAAGVRLAQPDASGMAPPPPGSRPGFDAGATPLAEDRLRPVTSVTTPGITYTVRADGDCAVVASSIATQPVTGGCSAGAPAGPPAVVSAYAVRIPTLPPPPGQTSASAPPRWPETMLVLVRSEPSPGRLTAALVDGRTVDVTMGAGGWGLLATEGRAFLIEVRDKAGAVLAQAPVT